MCGIAYKSNFYNPTNISDFIKSVELLKHRGPDEFGYLFTNLHSFGHLRLSIIDVKNGKQPMSFLNNHLIYNGEIYNTDELKELLIEKGLKIENDSDTYILLRMLIEYKEKALDYLNGIFSFVYTDNEDVYIVRDMFGVKPLYYSFIDNDIIVASEIKAILEYKHEAIVNTEGLCELIGMGPSHSAGKTIYKGIYEVKPGYMLKFNKENGLKEIKYYEIRAKNNGLGYKESVKQLRLLLDRAIKRQMKSDCGISCFLSGGLDSSIISTIAAKYKKNIDTYSVDYEDNNSDFIPNDYEISSDSSYAKLVSQNINSNHHDIKIDNNRLIEYLTRAVELRDSPGMTDIDSSMIYLAEKISEDNKVSLSGECSDELLGGYPWFYQRDNNKAFPWIRNIEFKEKLLNEKYRAKLNLKEYIQNEYNNAIALAPVLASDSEAFKKHRIMTYLNIKYFMTNLLDRKDRMTMGKSIEVRVPFCDKDLVEFLYNVPYNYKYKNKIEKKLLRDAYKDVVIKEVINRKKSPYPKSRSKKYEAMVKDLVYKCLEDKSSVLYKLFDIEVIKELLNSDDDLKIPWYGQLMRKTALLAYLYQIDYWYKKYNIRIED